jgi:hypothetical protein
MRLQCFVSGSLGPIIHQPNAPGVSERGDLADMGNTAVQRVYNHGNLLGGMRYSTMKAMVDFRWAYCLRIVRVR